MTNRRLEALSDEQCLRYLESASLGRIALQVGQSPAILPVNYAVFDGDVVFRTDPGSKLSAALMGVQVAFEVDSGEAGAGWSVVVVGYAEEVRDTRTLERIEELDPSRGHPGAAITSCASTRDASPGAGSPIDVRADGTGQGTITARPCRVPAAMASYATRASSSANRCTLALIFPASASAMTSINSGSDPQ